VATRLWAVCGRCQLKCDGTRSETRFRLSATRTSPFKSAGASVQSTTSSRGVRISGSNAGYITFRGSVKNTGYPLHSSVSPSLPSCASPCAITFQLESTSVYVGNPYPIPVTQWYIPEEWRVGSLSVWGLEGSVKYQYLAPSLHCLVTVNYLIIRDSSNTFWALMATGRFRRTAKTRGNN